jgi:integrase
MATINWRRGKKGDYAQLNWSENGVQRRISLGPIRPDEAELRRKAKEVELGTGEPIFVASMRFVDHRQDYLTWHESKYPDSHFRVRQILEQCCEAFEPKALSQITKRDAETWLAQRVARIGLNRRRETARVSRSTAGKEFRTVKALFAKAVQWDRMKRNPFTGVEEPKDLNSAPPHWYTKPQLSRFYACEPYGNVWKLIANAGLRRAEALQLKPEHVDLKRKVLHVLSTEDDRTKSGEWRLIPLNTNACDALRALLAGNATGYVIPHMTGPSLSRAFARDRRRFKLKGSLHSLRHSYGAQMVMAGVLIRVLQKLMGHAHIETTEIYAHVADDAMKKQARAVNF